MNKTDKYTDRELDELSGIFPGKIDVDRAWNKLHARLKDDELLTKTVVMHESSRVNMFIRIAAAITIVIALGAGVLYLINPELKGGSRQITAGNDERLLEITLPGGSRVWLGRNSQLSYNEKSITTLRNVRLKGEAFFEITHDAERPFTIDAGKASIKVLGTSFNVITSNTKDEVEVFVETGKVMLSDVSGSRNIIIEPGYVGTVNSSGAVKTLNENRNYLSWKTDLLIYEGEKLDQVFSDLGRVHNINVVTDDEDILGETITATFDRQPQDTIIRIICTTFNLSFEKDGAYYRLSKK
jgi:ferric-dicitrate binding protein FerR (iron transport regulator)